LIENSKKEYEKILLGNKKKRDFNQIYLNKFGNKFKNDNYSKHILLKKYKIKIN
jgi:hypothetical protein